MSLNAFDRLALSDLVHLYATEQAHIIDTDDQIRLLKQIVTAAVRYGGAEAFAAQQDAVELVMASADAQEGARAFAEKRPPVWRGR